MEKLLLTLLLLITTQISFAGIIVISDLDETIKHTSPGKATTWRIIKLSLFSKRVYRGMPQLFQKMDKHTDKQFIMTGSPSIIRRSMWKLINYHNIPIDKLITNRWAPLKKTYVYKYKKLTSIFKYYKDDQFILIGDNTGKDAKVYKEMAEKFPGQVLAIYIHQADSKTPEEGVTPFYSAYEVAVHEYKQGRMDYQEVEQIYVHIFENDKLSELFPVGGDCPTKEELFYDLNSEDFKFLTRLMTTKVIQYCTQDFAR